MSPSASSKFAMHRPHFHAALVLLLVSAFGGALSAAEPYEDFLQKLLQHGYGEEALDYLDSIATKEDVPVDLRQRFDLERSRAMQVAAAEAYDANQREARLKTAKELLEKFIKENPTHPEAGFAEISGGDDVLLRGQMALAAARGTRDAAVKEKSLLDARAAFSEARTHYEGAANRLRERLEKLPPPRAEAPRNDPAERLRENTQDAWLEGRFKVSLCDFLVSQTYPKPEAKETKIGAAKDPKEKERQAALTSAAKGFDSIYQEFRTRLPMPPAAFLAHMWHGRAAEELGDASLAMDIYDETLAGEPSESKNAAADANLFGNAALFRFRLLVQQAEPREAIAEGEEWLAQHKSWSKTSPYAGMVLEVAKLQIALAENVGKVEQKKLLRDVAVQLGQLGKIDSEYRQEALLLRQELLAKLDGNQGTLTYEELLAMGDDAAQSADWASAEDLYTKAYALVRDSKVSKDKPKIDDVRERLARVHYQLAVQNYHAGKYEEAVLLSGKSIADQADGPVAPNAAGVAIAAGVQIYTSAPAEKREEALRKLKQITDVVMKKWPDKAEADDARMALAQVELTQGNTEGAIELLKKVTSQSRRYAIALHTLAQIEWKRYVEGKKAEKAAEEIAPFRDQAIAYLQDGVKRQKESWKSDSEPMPESLFESQLLLAEIHMEGNQFAEAAPLYEPLVASVRATKPQINVQLLRLFIGAVRAQIAAGAPETAADTVQLAADLTADEAQQNAVVVDLAKLVTKEMALRDQELKDSAVDEATKTKAKETIERLKPKQTAIIDKLGQRKTLTVPQLIYLGDASTALEKTEQSREIYGRVIEMIEADKSAQASAGDAITRVRARMIGLLRSEGNLEEALKQADELSKAHPNALAPMLEKGRILQTLAESDPKRWQECVEHWTQVRVLLQQSRPRPPEYYEALYGAALGLVRDGGPKKDVEKLTQAEQMLRSTMVLSPTLSGEVMVKQYTSLLDEASKLKSQAAKKTKTRPTKGKGAPKGSAPKGTAPKSGAKKKA